YPRISGAIGGAERVYQALEVRADHEVLRLANQPVFDEPLGRLRLRDPALQLVEVPAQHRAPAASSALRTERISSRRSPWAPGATSRCTARTSSWWAST